jgi:hypothetical protein
MGWSRGASLSTSHPLGLIALTLGQPVVEVQILAGLVPRAVRSAPTSQGEEAGGRAHHPRAFKVARRGPVGLADIPEELNRLQGSLFVGR